MRTWMSAKTRCRCGSTVHALATVAVPLPGSADGWRPVRVTSGGSDLPATRDENGVLWVHLDAGVHMLEVSGPMPTGDAVEIPFQLVAPGDSRRIGALGQWRASRTAP